MDRGNEEFAKAISEGRHCAGFTADLAWLPADLVQAADYTLELPRLTGADAAALARSLCGGNPRSRLSDDQAAALTPRLLRLARRPGQTASDYVRKLRGLLAREETPRSAASVVPAPPREEPALDRLHGMDEAVAWGWALARDLAIYRKGQLPWADVDGQGLLLSGPPGCGKTLFARALAKTCGVPLVSGSWGQWHASGSGHQGDFLKAMRASFTQAREQAAAEGAAILFIDEVDSFPNRETVNHHYKDYEVQVVNALLAEIDGVEPRIGVVLLGACNHPHLLDPALVRSGRLDRHIRIALPRTTNLERILREHLGNDLPGVVLREAALTAAGASGADCERFVRGARRRAREARRAMTLADLMAEIGGTDTRSRAELQIAAIHEAGHAVVACAQRPGSLQAITLRGAGGSGGGIFVKSSKRRLLRSGDVDDQLVLLLAGRAAEVELLGAPSSGAGGDPESDLARATHLAAQAASSLGLDEESGLLWSGEFDTATLPAVLRVDAVLAARVKHMLAEAHERARELVREQRSALVALSQTLLERQTLEGAEAAHIVRRHTDDPSNSHAAPTEDADPRALANGEAGP
jgi:SpoVK/Ycf46/Vps4 family AAA+-type ATPase